MLGHIYSSGIHFRSQFFFGGTPQTASKPLFPSKLFPDWVGESRNGRPGYGHIFHRYALHNAIIHAISSVTMFFVRHVN